jgi:hypothetical protein
MNCLSGRVWEFVETAAFGCPAAPAADWPVPRKFSAEMTDLEHERHGFHGSWCGQTNQSPFGRRTAEGGCPHTIVPHVAAWTTQAL